MSDKKIATIKPTNLTRNLLHLNFVMMNFNRRSRYRFVSRCWSRHLFVRRLLARSGLLLAMGRHPDLGLMCYAKHRAAMWRSTLPTTLCTSTFTCAAALIDARLCINTQLVSVSWEFVMCLANGEFPIQSSTRFRLHKHWRCMWEIYDRQRDGRADDEA